MSLILATIRQSVEARLAERRERVPLSMLRGLLPTRLAEPRLRTALLAQTPAIIAEFKRQSPSDPKLALQSDPTETARAYVQAGAAALSVLTEEEHFGGSLEDLRRVREALPRTPILQKDFIVDEYQLLEAKGSGADAILLIVSMLGEKRTAELHALATELRLDALVEVHDEAEMAIASRLKAPLIGVNNRNLDTLKTSLDVSRRLAPLAPPEALLISESGFRDPAEINEMATLGYRAFLVGASLLKGGQPGQALATLRGGA